MRDPLRAPGGVGDGYRPCVEGAEHREPVQAQAIYDGLRVSHQSVQRVNVYIALRPPRTPNVVTDEHPLLRQPLVPAAALGDVPQLDVAPRSPSHVHEGHAPPERPEGDAYPIGCSRVPNTRFHDGDAPEY